MAQIKHWFLTGDTHGLVPSRLLRLQENYVQDLNPAEVGIIILGDAGINFYLNKTDKKNKRTINALGYHVYCVRGNHEERPENIPGMIETYDEEVDGYVYTEREYPNICYFKDGGEYCIDNHSVLVIGGAYSVDKEYRLARNAPWFKDEQLTQDEMDNIYNNVRHNTYDFVFTHTCPMAWEPTHLFLNGIDQSKVDKSMEIWLDKICTNVEWGIWCFGHYHADELVRPYVEMFSTDIQPLEEVYERWTRYGRDEELDWWLTKSPNFYWRDEE